MPHEIGASQFDIYPRKADKQNVQVAKPTAEKKTPGTLIVEKYRPRMNKLTAAERPQLRNRARQLAFGLDSEASPAPIP